MTGPQLIDPQGNPITTPEPAPEASPLERADPELAKAAFKFQYEKTTIWEETLRLTIAVRPWWCPKFFFEWAVRLVLRQEAQKKVHPEALTRRRAFKMFNGGRR